MENERVRWAYNQAPTHIRKKMGQAQRGVLLLSAAIAVVVLGILIAMWGERQVLANRKAKAERVGYALGVVGDALHKYVLEHKTQILENKAFTITRPDGQRENISRPREITVEQLLRYAGVRGLGTSPPEITGSSYVLNIQATQGTCTKAQAVCEIRALAYLNKPLVFRGKIDEMGLAVAARKIGQYGAYSTQDDPGVLKLAIAGDGVQDRIINPMASQPGLLARLADTVNRTGGEYLPLDGSQAMKGDLLLNRDGDERRNSIKNGDAITANYLALGSKGENTAMTFSDTNRQGSVFAGGHVITSGNVQAGGHVITSGNVQAEGNIFASGGVYARAGIVEARSVKATSVEATSVKANEDMRAETDVRAGNRLMMINNSRESAGNWCDGEPHFVRSGSRILACQNNRYSGLGDDRTIPITGCSKREYAVNQSGSRMITTRDCRYGVDVMDPKIVRFRLRFSGEPGSTASAKKALGRFLWCQRVAVEGKFQQLAQATIYVDDNSNWRVGALGLPSNGSDHILDVYCFGELS